MYLCQVREGEGQRISVPEQEIRLFLHLGQVTSLFSSFQKGGRKTRKCLLEKNLLKNDVATTHTHTLITCLALSGKINPTISNVSSNSFTWSLLLWSLCRRYIMRWVYLNTTPTHTRVQKKKKKALFSFFSYSITHTHKNKCVFGTWFTTTRLVTSTRPQNWRPCVMI